MATVIGYVFKLQILTKHFKVRRKLPLQQEISLTGNIFLLLLDRNRMEWAKSELSGRKSSKTDLVCTILPNALDPNITVMYFKKFLIKSHRRRDLYEADEEKGKDGFHGCCQWLLQESELPVRTWQYFALIFHIYSDVEENDYVMQKCTVVLITRTWSVLPDKGGRRIFKGLAT